MNTYNRARKKESDKGLEETLRQVAKTKAITNALSAITVRRASELQPDEELSSTDLAVVIQFPQRSAPPIERPYDYLKDEAIEPTFTDTTAYTELQPNASVINYIQEL